jgi:DNA-binding PucR family transcriptional regulator
MLAPLVRTYPQLAEDESLRQGLRRSTDTNLTVMLHVLAGDPPSSAEATADHLRFARILSRRDVALETVLESYRVGDEILRRLLLDEVASRASDADDLTRALRVASDQIAHYLGRTVTAVVAEYQRERESWMGQTVARKADLVRSLLRGDQVDIQRSERVIGYPLRTHHLGCILWTAGPEPSERYDSRISRQLAENFDAHGQLTLPAGPGAVWLWFAVDALMDIGTVQAGVRECLGPDARMAIGRVCANEHGFRRTHAQALRAERIATHQWTSARVVTYSEVEPLALIAQDPAEATEFAAHTLGPLAADDAGSEELRRTLAVYLDVDANARRAAERLQLHKNTILYRIRRAESLLGHSVDGHRTVLSMALMVVSQGPDS